MIFQNFNTITNEKIWVEFQKYKDQFVKQLKK